jgi:GT2 family glycosyltransferase
MASNFVQPLGAGLDQSKHLDVIIVNWNSSSHLRECIAALDDSSIAQNLRVIVVDNASVDGSADELVANRIDLFVLQNKKNVGFAAASNQGAACGSAAKLLFLNPDVCVRRDTIQRTVAYLEETSSSRVGIVGVQLIDRYGRVARSCARKPTSAALLLQTVFFDKLFPSLVDPHFILEWDHGETRAVGQVIGAYLAIRRSLFTQLGGFDERFFLYYEDLDLCVRANAAGWKVMYYADAAADHFGGGTTNAIKVRRIFYAAGSRIRFAAKQHGMVVAISLTLLTILAELPIRLFFSLFSVAGLTIWNSYVRCQKAIARLLTS